ncbi:MAG: oligosaccharide flippase family protein [Clostridia bacterium]|nr:oligosaccharide flippase family protein [Clostridia bacterium]
MKKQRQNNALIKNALIISMGGLIVKILGAFYRIPLTNLLKTEGLGIYQTAFPTYLILMTFTGAAATTTMTGLISAGENGKNVFRKSLAFFLPLGIVGAAFMIFLSGALSSMQGNPEAKGSYIALAPSLIFVAVISSVRGYFQGKNNMYPTAISQIIEQAVKIAVGLTLLNLFSYTPATGGLFACLAVSAGELVAAIYLIAALKKRSKIERYDGNFRFNRLITLLLPVAITSSLLPLARVFDSFTIINTLKSYLDNSVDLYGIYTGSVETIIGVPVAVCYGIATATVPSVSAAFGKGDGCKAKKTAFRSLAITLFASSLSFAFLGLFSKTVVNILYPKLSPESKYITIKLLAFSSINVVLVSLIQTETSILVSLRKAYSPALFLGLGLAVKFCVQIFLLKIPHINVFGALYSDILCYLVAVFGNLVYIIVIVKKFKMAEKDEYENNPCGDGRLPGRYIGKSVVGSEKR